MKFLSIITLATGISAAAVASKKGDGDGKGDPIPGTPGTHHCSDFKNEIWVDWEYFTYPQKVVRGQNITVKARGLTEGVFQPGATYELRFNKGGLLEKPKVLPLGDLCAVPKMSCGMIGQGLLDVDYELQVPESAPAGKWNFEVRIRGPSKPHSSDMHDHACVRGKVKVLKN